MHCGRIKFIWWEYGIGDYIVLSSKAENFVTKNFEKVEI